MMICVLLQVAGYRLQVAGCILEVRNQMLEVGQTTNN